MKLISSRVFPGLCAFAVFAVWTAIASAAEDPLARAAKQVFDARCVACHACYNAPCQLDLSSFEGLARGATDQRVYKSTRIKAAMPTRLGVDARSEAQWRERGFFSVLRPLEGDSPLSSVLGRMLALKRAVPNRRVTQNDAWMCPAGIAQSTLREALGRDGMPHGFPALSDPEYRAIEAWLEAGANVPDDPVKPLTAKSQRVLSAWERFLNDPNPRHRLVARYFYEHLFLAHIWFESADDGFHRLVRSTTPAPAAAVEIPTVRPYDSPGEAPFFYRFVPVTGTLVHKTHITFELSAERLERYANWFLTPAWAMDESNLPSYEPVVAANPFKAFSALPALARYRFFLDNARYFVMAFTRGPVCEGQMAVNVINDHFQVLFLDPGADLSVTEPAYLLKAQELLGLPTAGEGDPLESYYLAYKKRQEAFTAWREERYAEVWPQGMDTKAIWDGAKRNRNAALTVFRHFDNAAVVQGLRGGPSKTRWVIDYPIFERIYYLLVAGFNVYGNAFHQGSTRLYMDNLRVESEDLFLSFLPPGRRKELREFWYRGMVAQLKMARLNPLRGATRPTAIEFTQGNPERQFVALVKARLGEALYEPEPSINVADDADPPAVAKPSRSNVAAWLNRLTDRRLPFVAAMPDLSYLLVDHDDGSELYALVRNQAHLNVSFPWVESVRRVPDEDTLVVLKGVVGSYPNFMFRMPASRVSSFVGLLQQWTNSEQDRQALFDEYGVSRYRQGFWHAFDRLNAAAIAAEGLQGGLMDLSKYEFR